MFQTLAFTILYIDYAAENNTKNITHFILRFTPYEICLDTNKEHFNKYKFYINFRSTV